MKLTIEMPLTTYDCMMEGCTQSSPEFRLLVGGLIERRPKQNHFERFIQIFCEDRQAQILLNLARVGYIDSSGIGELIANYTTISRQGGQLKLLNLTDRIQNLLVITKLLTVFDAFDNEAEALKSFA